MRVEQSWSGPLPPPQALDQYNKWIPGLGEKIAENFIEESNHRRACETETLAQNRLIIEEDRKILNRQNRLTEITSLVVLALIATTILFGMFMLYIGRPWEGVGAIVMALAAVLRGKNKTEKQSK